jgi:hypothetical protein
MAPFVKFEIVHTLTFIHYNTAHALHVHHSAKKTVEFPLPQTVNSEQVVVRFIRGN